MEQGQETRGLFVRCIPPEMTHKELKQIFSEHGNVVSVVCRHAVPEMKYKWAIVNVESSKDVVSIIMALNGKPPFNFQISMARTDENKKRRMTGRDKTCPDSPNPDQEPWNSNEQQQSDSCYGRPAVMAQEAVNDRAEERHRSLPLVREGVEKAQVQGPQSAAKVFKAEKDDAIVRKSWKAACVHCGETGEMRCSVCKAWYCNILCQVEDWYHHKDGCRPPPMLFDPRAVNCSLIDDTIEAGKESIARKRSSESEGSDPLYSKRGSTPPPLTSNIGAARGRGEMLWGNVEENVAEETGLGRGRVSFNRRVDGLCASQSRPVRGRGAIIQGYGDEGSQREVCLLKTRDDLEGDEEACTLEKGLNKASDALLLRRTVVSPESETRIKTGMGIPNKDVKQYEKEPGAACESRPAETMPPNHSTTGTEYKEDRPPKLSSATEMVGGTAGKTAVKSPLSGKAEPSVRQEVCVAKSEVTPTKNVTEDRLNFVSLLSVGEVYNAFVTLMDDYKHFTAALTIECTECIFSDINEVCNSIPRSDSFRPAVGTLIAAFSPTDETWYRAQVLEADYPKYKVIFIDFGNKELVEQVKPIPEGPFSELPELALSARFYSGLKEDCEAQLKEIIQVTNFLRFKVIDKKKFSAKVILLETDCESDTTIAEYIFGSLLMHPSEPSAASASSPEAKTSSLNITNASPVTNTLSKETKVTTPEIEVVSPLVKDASLTATLTSQEVNHVSPAKVFSQEAEDGCLDTKATFPKAKAIFPETRLSPDPLKNIDDDLSTHRALALDQQASSRKEEDGGEQVNAAEGSKMESNEEDAVNISSSSGQSALFKGRSDLSTPKEGKGQSLYVAPLDMLELMMQVEGMATRINQTLGASTTPEEPHQPRRGEVCLARSNQDGMWYRALSISPGDSGTLLLFLDYGNTDVVMATDIRQIPKEFLELPCLALHRHQQEFGVRGPLAEGQSSTHSPFVFLAPFTIPAEGIMNLD